MAEKICEVVGQVIHSNNLVKIEGGNFMRIRVGLDVSLSLYRGRVVSLENGKKKLGSHLNMSVYQIYVSGAANWTTMIRIVIFGWKVKGV